MRHQQWIQVFWESEVWRPIKWKAPRYSLAIYYRLQTKFAKVVFTGVCLSTGWERGICAKGEGFCIQRASRALADLGGREGRTPPPGRPNSFDFMQFSGKFGVFTPPLEGSRPPSGKSWIRHCRGSASRGSASRGMGLHPDGGSASRGRGSASRGDRGSASKGERGSAFNGEWGSASRGWGVCIGGGVLGRPLIGYYRIQSTSEQAICILLECILV